jgi:hypothetical protein
MLTSLTIGLLVLASGAAFIYAAQQQRRCAREAAATNALRDHCAELERRNQRHQTILEHAMDGFFVLDEQGRFINVNPAPDSAPPRCAPACTTSPASTATATAGPSTWKAASSSSATATGKSSSASPATSPSACGPRKPSDAAKSNTAQSSRPRAT